MKTRTEHDGLRLAVYVKGVLQTTIPCTFDTRAQCTEALVKQGFKVMRLYAGATPPQTIESEETYG